MLAPNLCVIVCLGLSMWVGLGVDILPSVATTTSHRDYVYINKDSSDSLHTSAKCVDKTQKGAQQTLAQIK